MSCINVNMTSSIYQYKPTSRPNVSLICGLLFASCGWPFHLHGKKRKIGKMLTTIQMECHSKQSGKCGIGQLAFHDLQVIAHKHFKFP